MADGISMMTSAWRDTLQSLFYLSAKNTMKRGYNDDSINIVCEEGGGNLRGGGWWRLVMRVAATWRYEERKRGVTEMFVMCLLLSVTGRAAPTALEVYSDVKKKYSEGSVKKSLLW